MLHLSQSYSGQSLKKLRELHVKLNHFTCTRLMKFHETSWSQVVVLNEILRKEEKTVLT